MLTICPTASLIDPTILSPTIAPEIEDAENVSLSKIASELLVDS